MAGHTTDQINLDLERDNFMSAEEVRERERERVKERERERE